MGAHRRASGGQACRPWWWTRPARAPAGQARCCPLGPARFFCPGAPTHNASGTSPYQPPSAANTQHCYMSLWKRSCLSRQDLKTDSCVSAVYLCGAQQVLRGLDEVHLRAVAQQQLAAITSALNRCSVAQQQLLADAPHARTAVCTKAAPGVQSRVHSPLMSPACGMPAGLPARGCPGRAEEPG